MVEQLLKVTSEYEERLQRFSFGRRMPRDDGAQNRFILVYLFFLRIHGDSVPAYNTHHPYVGLVGVIFLLITYHLIISIQQFLIAILFLRTILIILRLGFMVLFFF
jgi:hypothetical protein